MNRVLKIVTSILIASTALFAVVTACNTSTRNDAKQPNLPSPLMKEANALTEKGYDAKQSGKNREALSFFEQAATKIKSAEGEKSEAFASNLDDQAVIYLRVGNSKKARELFRRAETVLMDLHAEKTRLFAGIRRRMATLDAFDKMGYACREPLDPIVKAQNASGPADGGASGDADIPYFPEPEKLQKAFGFFNSKMSACGDSFPASLPVWTVLTGDGRIAMCSVKSEDIDKKTRDCVEAELIELSRRFPERMPRFSACFRNFTYPLALQK